MERVIEDVLLVLLNNQNLLKCLKYDTTDALHQPDLTDDEKMKLINQEHDTSSTRVFFTPFNLNTADTTRAELHMYISKFTPDNINITNVRVDLQVIVHNRLWRLVDGKQRPLVMIQEILKSLNGVDVGFIGNLYFNNSTQLRYYNEYFTGYELSPNTRSV